MKKTLPIQNRNYTGVFRWLLIIAILIQMPSLSFAQNVVSGKVTSQEDGAALPGVNVVIKGTSTGTTTDVDGNYSLSVLSDATLVFSFIGFTTTEVAVNGRQVIDISLAGDTQTLDELVVTGYSTTRKKDITGSVAIVDVDNLQRVPSPSAEQALQGMAPGVNVTRSGVPGAGAKIFVRGVTNFGNTDPLVIVDGIQQDLNNISPQDIESIQVLKDAGSAAIYGVRGANGVILVTTKKGKAGAPVINYGASYRMAYPLPGNPFNLANTEEYVEIYNKAFPNNDRFSQGVRDYMYRGPSGAGFANEGDPAVDPSRYFYESPNTGRNYIIQKLNKEGTDWFHHLFKKAPTLDQNLNISGGTDKSKYLFGLGYIDQKGTLLNTYLKRYSGRVNTSFTLGDNIRIGENVNIIFRESPGFSENTDFGGITEVIKQQPFVPLKDIMGNWGGTFGGPGLGDGQNPVAVQSRNVPKDIVNQWHIIGNVFAEVDFLKNFTARTSLGYNIRNSYNQNFNTTQVENVQGNNSFNSLSVSAGYYSQRTFTNVLTYENTFDKHHFKMLVGSEAIDDLGRDVSASRQNFFSEDFNFLVLSNGTEALENGSGISSRSLFSLFSRIDYTFNDRYLLGLTVRRDGSSVFGPEQRYGVFPSVSAAWRISEESFMQDLSWLDDLKIRGSYGVLGSQNNVSALNSYSLFGSGMTTTYYDITGSSNSIVQGFAVNRIGNPATGWEENIVSNFGFDMAMFSGALEVSAEYYQKAIKGLLFTQPLPSVVQGGASAPSVNIGDIQNTGVDAAVKYRGSINRFRYSAGVNLTTYNNEVVDIPDPGYFFSGSHQGVGSMVRNEEGHPVSSFYGYRILGLFNSQEEVENAPVQTAAAPGRFRYDDINNDGLIDGEDRTHLGDPNPDLTYGINLNVGYGNFDLTAFLFGSHGNEIFNLTKSYTHFMGFYPTTNVSRDLLKAWTPENTDTNIPVVESQGGFSTTTVPNSFYIEDGSFLKLRSLSLGYSVPSTLLQKFRITNLRLYVQGENLFTLTKYSGLDPEIVGGSTSALGIDRGSYPNNEKGLLFGLNVTF